MNFDFLNKPSHEHVKKVNQKQQNQFQQNQFGDSKEQPVQKKINVEKKHTNKGNYVQNNKISPTLQNKLYPDLSKYSQRKIETGSKKTINFPSEHLSPRRPAPSDQAILILKNTLKKQQSSISNFLKDLIYLQREKVQQQVYNYATSVNRNEFVTGVMQVIDNFAAPSMEQTNKMKQKDNQKSHSSIGSMNIKFNQNDYNPYVNMSIHSLIDSISDKFIDQILYTSHYKIHKKAVFNKEDLMHLNKIDQKRLIEIKNSHRSIESTLDALRSQMHREYADNKKGLLDVSLSLNKKQSALNIQNLQNSSQYTIPQSQRKSNKSHPLSGLAQIYSIDQDLLTNDKNYFSQKHPKTKKVANFIRHLKQKKLESHLQYQQKIERQKQKYHQKVQKSQQQRQKSISQRHERLRSQFVTKKQRQRQAQQKSKQEQRKFQQFLKQYRKKKPLFIKLHQQFDMIKNQQEKLVQQKLAKIKQSHKPIDVDELNAHQQQYLNRKAEQMAKKKMQYESMQQDLKFLLQEMQQFHHGKFHKLIIEEEQQLKRKNMLDPRQEAKQLRKKRNQYGQKVKILYQPKIDLQKRIQSLSFKQKQSSRKPSRYSVSSSYKDSFSLPNNTQAEYLQGLSVRKREIIHEEPSATKLGLKNLRMVKQYVRQHIQKGLVVDQSKRKASQSLTLEPKINYMQQLHRKRQQQPRQSLDSRISKQIDRFNHSSKSKKDDVGYLRLKAQEIDSKAKRRQTKLRNNSHAPVQEKLLQQQYLAAIKLKLQLMQKYD